MNTFRTIFTVLFFLSTISVYGQDAGLYFSLQQLPDLSWGVYMKPDASLMPSEKTNTGTGQVTIVAPLGFEYTSFNEHAGTWVENARVDGPLEAPDKSYISFGFVNDQPKIQLFSNEETLLFTFFTSPDFDSSFYLFENGADVFSTPNSMDSNPGNEIGMLDFGTQYGLQTYRYVGNYNGDKREIMANMYFDDEDGNEEDEEEDDEQ